MRSPRTVSAQNCALVRYSLLSSALSGARDTPKALIEGCRTQAAFAALSIPSLDIEKVALNTLKVAADTSMEIGGWARLDGMRCQYRDSLKDSRRRRNPDVPTMSATDSLELERRFRVRLETAYVDVLLQLTKLAKEDAEIEAFLNRHRAGFSIDRMRAIAGGRRDGQGE